MNIVYNIQDFLRDRQYTYSYIYILSPWRPLQQYIDAKLCKSTLSSNTYVTILIYYIYIYTYDDTDTYIRCGLEYNKKKGAGILNDRETS